MINNESVIGFILKVMDRCGLSEDMVEWVGFDDGTAILGGWNRFKELYSEIPYESYIGWNKDPLDEKLVIVFNNGVWLSRYWNDGHVGWSYNKPPQKKNEIELNKPILEDDATGMMEYGEDIINE